MKTLKTLAAVLALCLSARADLLYWTVENANDASENGPGPISFAYATVSANGSYLNVYGDDGATDAWKIYAVSEDNTSLAGPVYSGSFDSESTGSVMVELWDSANKRVGWQSYAMAEIMSYVWKESGPGTTGASYLKVGDVVPEPSSALMLVFGGALLALRRRRA